LFLKRKTDKSSVLKLKPKATIKARELKAMLELSHEAKDNFHAGIIFYGGDDIKPISVEKQLFYCLPLGLLS
jgi:hypothetical protein